MQRIGALAAMLPSFNQAVPLLEHRRAFLRRGLILTTSVGVVRILTLMEPAQTAQATALQDSQQDWRYCGKCQTLFYDGYINKGICPAGGEHAAIGYNFTLPYGFPSQGQQMDWRYCGKCQAMFYDGYINKGICPSGGGHAAIGYNFTLWHDISGAGQTDWRYCGKCQAMFYDGYINKGICPARNDHAAIGYNFRLDYLYE